MSDLTPRDDLVADILNSDPPLYRDTGLPFDALDAGHIADALLAAGWVKTPEPAWDWGVQLWDGQVVPRTSRESAEEYAEWRATGGDRVDLVRRATTAGPWEVVGE